MKRNDAGLFDQPQREAWNALIFIVLENFWGLIRQLWVFILIYFFSSPDYSSLFFILFSAAISLIVLVSSIASYFRFSFYIKENKLHIKKGVFRRSHLNVPLERIQAINLEDNILHRLFQTVKVEVTTAGSSEKEFSIRSIDKETATALKDIILSMRKSIKRKGQAEDILLDSDTGDNSMGEFQKPLFKLGLSQLIKVGLSQNHFRAIGLILGAVGYFISQAQEFMEGDIFDWGYAAIGWSERADYILILMVCGAVILLALIISMVTVFLRFYNLSVYLLAGRLGLKHGLIQQREQNIQIKKLQILEWSDNPIRRIMDFVTIRLRQATSSLEQGGISISIPGCRNFAKEALVQKIFPTASLEPSGLELHPSMVWRYTLFRGAIPAIIAGAASFNFLGWWSLLLFIWIPVSYGINIRVYHNWEILWDAEHLELRRGFWSMRSSMIAWYKVQSVELKQSPFQVRKDIGNLWIYTAAGSLIIPYVKLQDAVRIKDYLLYQVERRNRNWM